MGQENDANETIENQKIPDQSSIPFWENSTAKLRAYVIFHVVGMVAGLIAGISVFGSGQFPYNSPYENLLTVVLILHVFTAAGILVSKKKQYVLFLFILLPFLLFFEIYVFVAKLGSINIS